MKFTILAFCIWRILIFIPLFWGNILLPFREDQEFTNILNKIRPDSIVSLDFLYPWANFDGVHYLSIAGNGYNTEARFSPFYSLIIFLFSSFLGDASAYSTTQFFTGFLISNIAFLAGLIFFYKLLRLDFSEKVARWAILFILVFPTSFFFGAIYSEAIFFLLMITTFYFARKRRWFVAGFLGLLLSSTRPVGIFILPALLYELVRSEKKVLSIKERFTDITFFKKLFFLLLIPLGIIGYAWFNNIKWGSYTYFLTAQGELGNSRATGEIVLPPQTLARYLKILTSIPTQQFEWWVSLLEVMTFITVSFLLYLCWKTKIRGSYLIFSALAFLLPVLSGTFSGLPRYVLVLFPIYIVLGMIKDKFFKISCILVSCFLLSILLIFFSKGYYIS